MEPPTAPMEPPMAPMEPPPMVPMAPPASAGRSAPRHERAWPSGLAPLLALGLLAALLARGALDANAVREAGQLIEAAPPARRLPAGGARGASVAGAWAARLRAAGGPLGMLWQGALGGGPSLAAGGGGESQGGAGEGDVREDRKLYEQFHPKVKESTEVYVTMMVFSGFVCICFCAAVVAGSDDGEPARNGFTVGFFFFVLFFFIWLNKMIPFWNGTTASAAAVDIGCRWTEQMCMESDELNVAQYFDCLGSDPKGMSVVCDVDSIGSDRTGGSGKCLCPEGWCFTGGRCTPGENWTADAWPEGASLDDRLREAAGATSEDRREVLTFWALDRCEGLVYRSGINLDVNPELHECAHLQKLIEGCGTDVAAFYVKHLRGNDIGTFLEVALTGVLIGACAKLALGVLVSYLATTLLQEKASMLYDSSSGGKKKPDDSGSSSGGKKCTAACIYLLRVLLLIFGLFVLLQLFWLAAVDTILAWKANNEYMKAIADFEGPCDFYLATQFISYGKQAELLALCFVSLFDAVTWAILLVWCFLLCFSHLCFCCGCCCSYIFCCKCCLACSCSCLLGKMAAAICLVFMLLILAIPLVICVLGVTVCIAVWVVLAALVVVFVAACIGAVVLSICMLGYGAAVLVNKAMGKEFNLTWREFLSMWGTHLRGLLVVLVLGWMAEGLRGRPGARAGRPTKLSDRLVRFLKLLRLNVALALVLPLGCALLIFLAQSFGRLSFSRYVAAQVDMEPFQYPPEPEYVYSIKNTWDNYFVEYFPWLVREMYNILPILFSDVPAGLWREIANMGAIATPNIGASFAASFAKLTSYLSEVDYDIDKLVNLNFWLRVVLAFLEGWFFFFVVCLQKVQADAEAATQLVAARVADLEGDLGLGEDLAGGGGGVMGEVREGLFADMVGYGCLRANDCIGGFDQKSSGKDMERPVAEEDVLVFARGYAGFLEQLWFAKKRSVLEELCENCRMGADDGALQGVNLNVGLVLRLGTELAKRYPDFFRGDQRFASAAVAFVSAFLYTMQDVDIDRTHLFNDVPSVPVGEESPAARDMVFKPYRVKLKDAQVARNPQMFQTACGATRQRWDIYSKEREQENESIKLADSDEEQKQQHAEKVAADAQWKATVETELTKWVKWVTLLGVMRQPLPNVTTSRGLCGLPPFIIESLMQKKPGDSIFWAAMSSTTLDSSISESYANQAEPVDRNILFTIENITEGLALHSISMYPKEKEILLPPLTLLKVKEATPPETDPPKPGRIVCEFDGCYLTDRLQRACEEDLAECTALLEAAARASAAEQRPKNGLIGKATGAKPGKVAPA